MALKTSQGSQILFLKSCNIDKKFLSDSTFCPEKQIDFICHDFYLFEIVQ